MIEAKSQTHKFIDQLNGTERVLAELDQVAGDIYPLARACRKAYLDLEQLRNEEVEGWNGDLDTPEFEKVHRCKFAAEHYHTDEDAPCEIWGLNEVCEYHRELA